MNARQGWSLLELIVALAILAVLLSITIPALRGVAERSQTTKNLANMSLTMKDFFTWSTQNNGRMINAGLPPGDGQINRWYNGLIPTDYAQQIYLYPSQTAGWPNVLYLAFGEASPHWQSTYANPEEWLFDQMSLAEARRLDPTWEWRIPSDYLYSMTMLTNPSAWQYPGLALGSQEEFAKFFGYILHADIAHPSAKGVLWHDHIEEGPGRQRLTAFADGAVAQRDMLAARPSAAHPTDPDTLKRAGPIGATLNGALGQDF